MLREYDRQVVLFEILWDATKPHLLAEIVAKHDPVAAARANRDRPNLSLYLSGLKQAVRDSCEALGELPLADRQILNETLSRHGFPSLESLNGSALKTAKSISRRNAIRSDEEYYLVTAILADVEASITVAQRERLGEMVAAYEAQAGAISEGSDQ